MQYRISNHEMQDLKGKEDVFEKRQTPIIFTQHIGRTEGSNMNVDSI